MFGILQSEEKKKNVKGIRNKISHFLSICRSSLEKKKKVGGAVEKEMGTVFCLDFWYKL